MLLPKVIYKLTEKYYGQFIELHARKQTKKEIWVDFQKSFQVGFDKKIDKLYIGRFGQVLVESFSLLRH